MIWIIIYIICAIATYTFTSITIRNPNDEDRNYADPSEWDFSHVGAAIVFPIFWIGFSVEHIGIVFGNLSKYLYDKFNKKELE